MTSGDNETIQRIVGIFEDTIADSGKLREGLTDDDAIPLVEWGVAYARAYAHTITHSGAPLPSDQTISDQAYNLTRLMTRLNWVVTYRDRKDATWLTNTLLMANKLSRDLLGANAPVMAEATIPGWLEAQRSKTISEMLRDLMARYSPQSPASAAGEQGAVLLLPATTSPQAQAGTTDGVLPDDMDVRPARPEPSQQPQPPQRPSYKETPAAAPDQEIDSPDAP